MLCSRLRLFVTGAVVVIVGAFGAGTASAAFPGQNGVIAFTRTFSVADDEIFVMDADGQNQVPLTDNTVNDEAPAFSPDGERIAFRRGGVGGGIFVMDADGQNQVQLTSATDSEPVFSPDGRIAFTRDNGGDAEIFVMDASGQNQVNLTNNSGNDFEPAFSPDGGRIAFTRYDGITDSEIFAMDADGRNQVPLTDNTVSDTGPAFSPDGGRIAFSHSDGTDSEIFAMDASGQNQVPLTANSLGDIDPAFSPDGGRIAFDHFDGAADLIFVMDASGQNQVPLTANSVSDYYPDWQPLNAPAFDLSGRAKQKSVKVVSVTATSQNEDATATIGGTLKAPKVPKSGAVAAKAKRFELAPVTVELQPGQPATLDFPIPKKARKLLKRGFKAGKKGKVTLAATAIDDLGASSEDSQQVKLKKKQKKKK
jgi:Tol biopolymer transport system component